MTKDEALKMAIEAIEFEGVRDSEDYWLMMDKVRTACKDALEQPKEPQYLYVYGYLENQNISFEKTIGMPYIGKIRLEVDDD